MSVAAKTRIAAKAGVVRDIEEAGDYAGHPAMVAKDYKQQVGLGRPESMRWPEQSAFLQE